MLSFHFHIFPREGFMDLDENSQTHWVNWCRWVWEIWGGLIGWKDGRAVAKLWVGFYCFIVSNRSLTLSGRLFGQTRVNAALADACSNHMKPFPVCESHKTTHVESKNKNKELEIRPPSHKDNHFISIHSSEPSVSHFRIHEILMLRSHLFRFGGKCGKCVNLLRRTLRCVCHRP